MLKGFIGLKTIFALLIGLLVLGVLASSVTIGPLGTTINQGLDDVGMFTDFTTEIDAGDDDAEETFSDLAMFVRDRAVGCEEVRARHEGIPIDDPSDDPSPNADEEGYPGLEETILGLYPICTGGSATPIRDRYAWIPTRGWLGGGPEDDHMPGTLSREQFEIVGEEGESIYFQDRRGFDVSSESDYGDNDYWLENNIAGVSSQPWENHIDTEGRGYGDYWGSGRNYVFFFEDPTVGEKRTNLLLSDWTEYDLSDRVWKREGNLLDQLWAHDGNADLDYVPIRYHPTAVVLCPGDKGYIQVNRDTPMNTGLAEETDTSNYYPMVVIEESEVEQCEEDLGLGESDKIPDNTPSSARLLHIASRTTNSHPYVHELGSVGQYSEYSFNLHQLNENNDISQRTGGSNINYNYRSDRSDQCVIGLYDSRSVNRGDTGWVSVERGTMIRKTGSFPARDSSDVAVDRTSHRDSGPFRPRSSRDIYDRHVDDGFTQASWEDSDLTDGFIYNYGGETKYQLYTDLVCAPHEDNAEYDDDLSAWNVCDRRRTIEVNGDSWTCNTETGEWE